MACSIYKLMARLSIMLLGMLGYLLSLEFPVRGFALIQPDNGRNGSCMLLSPQSSPPASAGAAILNVYGALFKTEAEIRHWSRDDQDAGDDVDAGTCGRGTCDSWKTSEGSYKHRLAQAGCENGWTSDKSKCCTTCTMHEEAAKRMDNSAGKPRYIVQLKQGDQLLKQHYIKAICGAKGSCGKCVLHQVEQLLLVSKTEQPPATLDQVEFDLFPIDTYCKCIENQEL